jgi:Protein kinase domain
MANLEYDISYKAPVRSVYRNFFIGWAALGLLLAFFLSRVVIPAMASGGSFVQYVHWLAWSILIGAVYSMVPYLVFVSSRQEQKLQVSRQGVGLPGSPNILGPLNFVPGVRTWRVWSDLQSVAMTTNTADAISESDHLLLGFKDGANIKLYLSGLNKKDLNHLLMSIELFARQCQKSPEIQSFQNSLQNATNFTSDVTYTKIWEEELGRRFHSTTFIPLGPGATLGEGRLQIIRQIAFGGSSAVYLARDRFGNDVVVKESVIGVDAIGGAAQKAAEFFEREAKLLMVLKHPAIAKVQDHFVENGHHFLIIQYIPGESLRQMVSRTGPLPEKRVLDLALQMADILQYLHTHQPVVIHRDFTPDNLLMKPDGNLVLIDFGAANEFVGTATGTLIGKQCYMPPEQVRGKTCPASDIYGFGCTLEYLLTGLDPEALAQSHPRQRNPRVSERTDQLVAQLTDQDKDKRPRSAQLAAMAVESIRDGEGEGDGAQASDPESVSIRLSPREQLPIERQGT